MPSDTTKPTEAPFEAAVSEVLTRLRAALAEVIAAVPGEVAKGADLHRALDIDRKLSWKVYKLASAPDPVAAGPHVPSRGNLNTFFKAAASRGVPSARIEAAARVAADFEEMVARHAGDRATFDSMVSALLDDGGAEQIDLAHRRIAFRGQRHILGVQARTKLKLLAVQPSADPNMLDIAGIEGFIALRRLRCNAILYLSGSGAMNDDGTPRRLNREPIDPTASSHGMALLRDFCSKPLPQFRTVEVTTGMLRCELANDGVGNRAAITCLEGHVVRAAVPRYRDERNRVANYIVEVLSPCQVLMIDLLAREDVYESLSPSAHAFSQHLGRIFAGKDAEGLRLPLHVAVTHIGKGPSVLHSPDVPRYPELGRYLFDRLGWDGDRFDVYRCRIEYPVMPSKVTIRLDLPAPPA